MRITIRNRAAALGIAAATGLVGIGVAGGPALASTNSEAERPAAETSVAQQPQSAGYPKVSAEYADRMVRSWGAGDDSGIRDRASQTVVDDLAAHGDEHATRWHRIAADTGEDPKVGTTHVAYVNWDTDEVMTLRVDNVRSNEGDAQAVRQVRFHG